MALQLKIGDLTLSVIETWGEAVDWPINAVAIPGNWAGVAIARKPEPRKINLAGFIGQDAADLLAQHRSDYSDLVTALNNLTESARRTNDGLWELWHEDDRYIRVLPISFVSDSEGNVPWATRFTCQVVASDPRWYNGTWSTSQPTLTGTSNWHSIQLYNYGDAPTNPALHLQIDAATAVTFTNRRKNVLANALFREGNSADPGIPKSWSGDSQLDVAFRHFYKRYIETWGRAYVHLLTIGGNAGTLYQDVKMNEAATIWSLSGIVSVVWLAGTTPEFHLRLDFLGSDGGVLATYNSTTLTSTVLDTTLTILNKTAPAGTHYIRVAFEGTRAIGDEGRAYCRGIQLERGATNTTIDYKAQSTVAFQWVISELTDIWVDSREQESSYLTVQTSNDPADPMTKLSAGAWLDMDSGVNEFLVDVTGAPTQQNIEVNWQDAYWGK